MIKKKYYTDRIRQIGNEPYLIFKYSGGKSEIFKSKYQLIPLLTNDKTKTASLDFKNTFDPEPLGYLDSVASFYHYLCNSSPSTFIFAYADSLYDFDLRKMIPIPYNKGGGELVPKLCNHYAMKNPFTKNYHLVYSVDKASGFHNIIFDKNGKLISNKKVKRTPQNTWNYIQMLHPYQLLYFDSAKKTFGIYDL